MLEHLFALLGQLGMLPRQLLDSLSVTRYGVVHNCLRMLAQLGRRHLPWLTMLRLRRCGLANGQRVARLQQRLLRSNVEHQR